MKDRIFHNKNITLRTKIIQSTMRPCKRQTKVSVTKWCTKKQTSGGQWEEHTFYWQPVDRRQHIPKSIGRQTYSIAHRENFRFMVNNRNYFIFRRRLQQTAHNIQRLLETMQPVQWSKCMITFRTLLYYISLLPGYWNKWSSQKLKYKKGDNLVG